MAISSCFESDYDTSWADSIFISATIDDRGGNERLLINIQHSYVSNQIGSLQSLYYKDLDSLGETGTSALTEDMVVPIHTHSAIDGADFTLSTEVADKGI